MLPEQLVGDCANLHHGRGTFEGFDFVGEAEDVVVGRAFGLSPVGPFRFSGGGLRKGIPTFGSRVKRI